MEEEIPTGNVYREPELSDTIRNRKPDEKYGKGDYVVYIKGMIYLPLVTILLLTMLMSWNPVGIVCSLFFLVLFLIVIAGLRIHQLKGFVPLEISDEYIALPPGLSLRYFRGEDVHVPREDITKICPWRVEGVVAGLHIEVEGRKRPYTKLYPCPEEEVVREIIQNTLEELKRRFPGKYWEALGKKE